MLPLKMPWRKCSTNFLPTKTETLALTEATDRVCAEDVISPINVPLLITPRWMVMQFV